VHQYSSFALAVSEDIIRELVASVPTLLEADRSCSPLGVGMSSSHRLIGREIDAQTLLPFGSSLEHVASVGIIGLRHEGVLVVSEDIVGETIVACNLS